MTINFSGLASGLDTSSWVEALVSVKQEKITTLKTELDALNKKQNTVTSTRASFNNLRSAIEKFTDTKFGGTFDLFGKNIATSSNDDIFSAVAGNGAVKQNYDIFVNRLATCTKVASTKSASAVADDDTELSVMGVKGGSLSIYVDGAKTAIEIDKDFTLGDLKSKLAEAGVKTVIDENGVMNLSLYDSTQSFVIGSTTDTANIVSLFGLEKQEDGTYVSQNSLFKASAGSKLTEENSGFNERITAGTFTIGDATFTINDKTTLSSLITQINESTEAQVNAYWDDTTGKLILTSTKEGASLVNIQAGTSNFTDVMNLTETERDAEGNPVNTKMLTEAQEMGQNALFTINGTSYTSASNTVSSDISRISGVTITLKNVSTDEEGKETKATLKVEQDTSGLVDAVKSFISAYNDTMSKIDEVTASGADLQRETTLTSFKNTMRNYANGSNTSNGGAYKLLSQLGISTGKADGNNLSTDTTTLEFDEETFLKALKDDPESVKSILGGENGIFSQMENTVEQTLQAATGFFDLKSNTLKNDMSKLTEKISKQQTNVNTYQKQLEDKFYKMELAISQMQQNYSNFLSA